jgi:hypothetical protein
LTGRWQNSCETKLSGEAGTSRSVAGIVVTDQAWYAEAWILAKQPVIAVGGPPANRLADEFDKLPEGKYPIPIGQGLTGFFRKNQGGLPQVALWGPTASGTREAVEHYLKNAAGLDEFLKICWK